MKLKPIAASICLLGFAATPVFANGDGAHTHAAAPAVAAAPNATPAQSGVDQTNIRYNQADLAALQARENQAQMMDEVLNNNQGALIDQDPELGNDWFKRIKISGQLNVDGRFSDTSPNGNSFGTTTSFFNHGYSSGLNLNDSELDVDAQVNNWAKLHIGITGQDSDPSANGTVTTQKYNTNDPWLDEAYVTIGELNKFPVYFTAGREYADFGYYRRHELTPLLTTDLTETQGTIAKLGFEDYGVYAGVYGMSGLAHTGEPNRLANGGANLGYAMSHDGLMVNVGGGFLANMVDVNDVSNFITGFGAAGTGNTYNGNVVPAFSGHANASYGPFDVEINGVTASTDFGTTDLSFDGDGAQPWAVGIRGGYKFKVMDHQTKASLSYDRSGDALGLGLPQDQFIADYMVNLNRYLDVELQYVYNHDYSSSDTATAGGTTSFTGTGRGNSQVAARVSVRV